MFPSQSQFGENFGGFDSQDSLAATAPKQSPGLSFLRPTNSFGEPVSPSYTKYANSAVSSYTHPLHALFNDRRTAAPSVKPLYGQKSPAMPGAM